MANLIQLIVHGEHLSYSKEETILKFSSNSEVFDANFDLFNIVFNLSQKYSNMGLHGSRIV